MKIPKTFLPEKNNEAHIERLLKRQLPEVPTPLTISCGEFIERIVYIDYYKKMYDIGEEIAQGITYTKADLEKLVETISIEELESQLLKSKHKSGITDVKDYLQNKAHRLGAYISSLANKIMTENETIKLKPIITLSALGTCLEKGILTIEGDAGSHAGFIAKKGEILITGSAGPYLGALAEKEVEIYVGGIFTPDKSNFWASSISENCKARIYEKGELIWPKK